MMAEAGGDDFGVYVHWPYCSAICPYCDFNVYRDRGQEAAALVDAICADLRGWRSRTGPRRARTVFFGGGTPSLMSREAVERIINAVDLAYGLDDDAEISLEANPEHITVASLGRFVTAGVTRLSLGVQSLRDAGLRRLGRAHTADEARAAVAAALSEMDHVSVDMIYARDRQRLVDWEEELREALTLGAPHLSTYQLTIEPGTAFERQVARGELMVPNEDDSASFFALTRDLCADAGYASYEISNHARSADEKSRHNGLYWASGEWIGVGPGAHGRIWIDGGRCAAVAARRPETYVDLVRQTGSGAEEIELLSRSACAQEYLLMGLRRVDGVCRTRYAQLAGKPLDETTLTDLTLDGVVCANTDRVWVAPAATALTGRIAMELAPG